MLKWTKGDTFRISSFKFEFKFEKQRLDSKYLATLFKKAVLFKIAERFFKFKPKITKTGIILEAVKASGSAWTTARKKADCSAVSGGEGWTPAIREGGGGWGLAGHVMIG